MIQFFIQNSEVILRLFLAVVLGMLIGAERELLHKDAGMKTHSLVALGAAVFVLVGEGIVSRYANVPGFSPTLIAAQIIVGIGFLGAGSIILQNNKLKGLTTASGLWVTAGMGMAAGFGLYALAVVSAIFILFIFVAMALIEKPIREISGDNLDRPK